METGNSARPSAEKATASRQDALAVVLKLREAGHIAYFAGGCVRDTLLGLAAKDYDVATDAPPETVRKVFPKTQAVGAAFGVILVRQGKSVVEVATFRTDGAYSDGRRPDTVRFATAQEDAQRRDFTINGLFFDPVNEKLIDYVGGQQDLADRRLRAIGDASKRFEEDHLRTLRAVRFAARFDLQIEPDTAAAIRAAARRLKEISPERIAEELRLMLTPTTRARAWALLWELELGPVIVRLVPAATEPKRNIFQHVSPAETISFALALAALVLDVQEAADFRTLVEKSHVRRCVAAIRKTLRISNEEMDAMQGALEGVGPLLADAEPGIVIKKRFLAEPTANLSQSLLDALAKAGHFVQRIQSLKPEFDALANTDFAPLPLLTGDDLTGAGMTPGPAFKRILHSVYDAQLEGKVASKQEAMEMAHSMAKQPPLSPPSTR